MCFQWARRQALYGIERANLNMLHGQRSLCLWPEIIVLLGLSVLCYHLRMGDWCTVFKITTLATACILARRAVESGSGVNHVG